MPTKTQLREQARANLRQAILEAARALVASDGYAGLSMRRLAASIGYTPKTIYLYFADKDDLLSELIEADLAGLVAHLETAANVISDPVQRLHAVSLAYVAYGLAHPHAYQVMFMIPEHPLSREAAQTNQHVQGRRLLETLTRTLAESGLVSAEQDLQVVTQALRCALHGVVALRLVRPHTNWAPWETLVAQLVTGVAQDRVS